MFCFPIKSRIRRKLLNTISLLVGAPVALHGVLKYEFGDFPDTEEAIPNTNEVVYDKNLIPKPIN